MLAFLNHLLPDLAIRPERLSSCLANKKIEG